MNPIVPPDYKEKLLKEFDLTRQAVSAGIQLVEHLRSSPFRSTEKTHATMFLHSGVLWLQQLEAGITQSLDMVAKHEQEEARKKVVETEDKTSPASGKTFFAEVVRDEPL